MNSDQLFEELRLTTSPEKRKQLIEFALQSGIGVSEVSEMLDFLEACANDKEYAWKSKHAPYRKRAGVLASFLQTLFCKLRWR